MLRRSARLKAQTTTTANSIPSLPRSDSHHLLPQEDRELTEDEKTQARALYRDDQAKTRGFKLFPYELVPMYLQDNHYIRHGFRVGLSWKNALRSLFIFHNESANIWSHLLGLIGVVVLHVTFLYCDWTEDLGIAAHFGPGIDRVPFWVFLVGLEFQLLASSWYHLVCCVGPDVYKKYCVIDYAGVILSIYSGNWFTTYYMFHDDTWWMCFHLLDITIFTVAALIVMLMPVFQQPKYQTLRAVVFLTLGWLSTMSLFHATYRNGYNVMKPVLWGNLKMGLLYSAGAIVYASHIPERFAPGKFDYFTSHFILHMFVLGGDLQHILNYFDMRSWRAQLSGGV